MYFGLMAYWSDAPAIIAVVIGAGLIVACFTASKSVGQTFALENWETFAKFSSVAARRPLVTYAITGGVL